MSNAAIASTKAARRKGTARKGDLTLVFSAPVGDRSLALRLEYRVKQLTKRQKSASLPERDAFRAVNPANPGD